MTTDADRFVQAMKDLCPGDVITNLVCCEDCNDLKVLVLEITDGAIQLSLKSDEQLSITRDSDGPFRWDETEQYLVKNDGKVPDHIGRGVSVLKAGGLKEVALYDRLAKYRQLRLDMRDDDFARLLKDDPTIQMVLDALIDDDGLGSLAKMEACINFAFQGRANPPLSSREIMRLLAVICLITDSVRRTDVGPNFVLVSREDFEKLSSSFRSGLTEG